MVGLSFLSFTLVALSIAALSISVAHAQVESGSVTVVSEDVEPRNIGTAGTMVFGVAGFVDRFHSSERSLPTNYTAQIDVGRFISDKFLVRGGLAGSGSFGGDDDDERPTGAGAPSLHAFGGLLYYFTPQSMVSLYSGAEYSAQLTQRAEEDAGSIVGRVGLQGAVSSRASVFIEGGYGVGLTKGDEGELVSRFIGQFGIRLKF
jgi:hypothetical protein